MSSLESWFLSLPPLPWRDDKDPYLVIILEIISQQTTLSVMLKRYPLFIQKFPTIVSLAEASQEEILLEWEGLGYYRRAINLHKMAKEILTNGYPSQNLSDWLQLPGIGQYTAAAILSRCYGLPILSLDVNVKRVIMRFLNKSLWNNNLEIEFKSFYQYELHNNANYFNQALIRLGQLICKKKEKLCATCPLSDRCMSKALPLETVRSSAKKIIFKESYLLLITSHDKFLLEKNSTGIGENLYRIPTISKSDWENFQSKQLCLALTPRVHTYTKYKDKLFTILSSDDKYFLGNKYVWIHKDDLKSKPFMSSYRLIMNEAIASLRQLNFLLGLS